MSLPPLSQAASLTDTSEITIPAPHLPYKVVLRPDVTSLPDSSYFQVTDWIYSQEAESVFRKHSQSPPTHTTVHKPARSQDFGQIKQPYLVDKTETEPGHRELLREKLCMDLNSFYYYKERHLFRPRNTQKTTKLPQLPTQNSPKPPSNRSPPSKFPKHRQSVPLSPSKPPPFLTSLLSKCSQIPPSTLLYRQTHKEWRLNKQLSRRLNWARETLGEVNDCEAEVLIPYYRLQKEALEDFEKDAKEMVGEFRRNSGERREFKRKKAGK